MLNIRELTTLAKSLATVVSDHVGKAVGEIRAEFAQLRTDLQAEQAKALAEAVAALPVPEAVKGDPGADAPAVDTDALLRTLAAQLPTAEQVAALIPVPEAIKGDPGADAPAVDTDALLRTLAAQLPTAEQVAALIPVPEAIKGDPGADAPAVDTDALLRTLAAQLPTAEQVAALVPVPEAIKGDRGDEGDPGRDALQIDVLPSIDPDRAYAKGTYASHNGGMWVARRTTKGMEGWDCIVNGWGQLEVVQFERGAEIKLHLSNGEVVGKRLSLPSMIYRGVFAPGQFEQGDTVTWGGSLWHCDEPTTDKPGEVGSKGWTLAAKRGRDGKDGINGRDLTKGVQL